MEEKQQWERGTRKRVKSTRKMKGMRGGWLLSTVPDVLCEVAHRTTQLVVFPSMLKLA
jgi:hypothetical protein